MARESYQAPAVPGHLPETVLEDSEGQGSGHSTGPGSQGGRCEEARSRGRGQGEEPEVSSKRSEYSQGALTSLFACSQAVRMRRSAVALRVRSRRSSLALYRIA